MLDLEAEEGGSTKQTFVLFYILYNKLRYFYNQRKKI